MRTDAAAICVSSIIEVSLRVTAIFVYVIQLIEEVQSLESRVDISMGCCQGWDWKCQPTCPQCHWHTTITPTTERAYRGC